jgi:hypothetical protein
MRGKVLLVGTCVLALAVPAADTAVRPARFLLAVAGGGTASLAASSDGVRFSAALASWPGTAPSPIRRGATVYVYDSPTVSAAGLSGTVRRFAVSANGSLTGKGSAGYTVQLASPEDAQRATPGSFAPSVGVDEDTGALVLFYALRYEPATNACPVAGQACVKLRTATENSGSDGAAFTGDRGNRVVISFAPSETVGSPALFRAENGWAALFRGPAGCVHLVTGRDLRGHFKDGCVANRSPESPSALWSPMLHQYRLYGVAGGRVVRTVSRRLATVVTTRFRPLDVAGRPSFARVAANIP